MTSHHTQQEIADTEGVSRPTVEDHVASLSPATAMVLALMDPLTLAQQEAIVRIVRVALELAAEPRDDAQVVEQVRGA